MKTHTKFGIIVWSVALALADGCLNILTPSRRMPGKRQPQTPHRFSSHLLRCYTLNAVLRKKKKKTTKNLPGSSCVTSGIHTYNFYPCVNSHVQTVRTLPLRQFCAINIQFQPANVYRVMCVYVHCLGLSVIYTPSSVRHYKLLTVCLLLDEQFYFMSFVH